MITSLTCSSFFWRFGDCGLTASADSRIALALSGYPASAYFPARSSASRVNDDASLSASMSRFLVLPIGFALAPPLVDFFDDLDFSCPRASGIDEIHDIVNAA